MLKLKDSSGKLKKRLEKVTYRQMVIAAVIVSCLMGVMVYLTLSGNDSAKSNNEAKAAMVKVVVAKQDIPDRTVIQESMLKVIDVPADIVPPGAFNDVSEAMDRPTSTAVQQGDILTDKKVYTDIRMAGFTGTIPPNCRAVSVGITDVTGVSGFAKPGDYVDVMVIFGKKEDGLKGEVLMQNVLLLAINKTGVQSEKDSGKDKKDVMDKSKDNSSMKGSSDAMATATLALPLDEALKLAVAAQKGTIYLVLRPYNPSDIFTLDREFSLPGDKPAGTQNPSPTTTPAPQSAAPSVSRTPSPAYTPPAAAPVSAPAPARSAEPSYENSIEVIRGTESTRVGVN